MRTFGTAREYDNLYRAAAARAEADWLVGINATRALTCKYNAQLSCGRVQTPTLAMIARTRAGDHESLCRKNIIGMTSEGSRDSVGAGRIRRAEATAPLTRNGRKS